MTIPGLVVAGLAAAVLLVQAAAWLRARRLRGAALPDLPGPLGDAVGTGGPHLIVFTRRSCPACRAMAPELDALRTHRNEIRLVDVEEDPAAAQAFGILGTPTTVLVRNGRIVSVHHGTATRNQLEGLMTP